ncbi:cytidylyltransferase domain-containing protein, partial [Hansschlegelia beijingensis]
MPSLRGPLRPLVLIPARLGATRLPNKPLAEIAGEPMIAHVWRRASEAGVGPVVVVTNERNGPLVASFPVEHADQIMLVTNGGQTIRV